MKKKIEIIIYACITVIAYSCNDAASNDIQEKGAAYKYTNSISVVGQNRPTDEFIHQSPVDPPEGMIYVQGGHVHLGSDEGAAEERPRIWATVQPFFMDVNEVTVLKFRNFIKATGYKTEAEKFGNAGVFINNRDNWWELRKGANWEYPQGKENPKAKDDHPVTQVSWNDAVAYARWAGKRLPSEIEWEHAARNGNNSNTRYSWGEDAKVNGKWMLNFFQGSFPGRNIKEDSYEFTAPVGSFGKSALGLADMSGNVWELCADNKISYSDFAEGKFTGEINERAIRGGSFLCETSICHGYRVSSRSFITPETSLMHIGFRCVKDIK